MISKCVMDFPELEFTFINSKKVNEITIVIYILLTILLLTKFSVIN